MKTESGRFRRKKNDPKLPKYFLEIVGLGSDSLGGTVDSRIRLIQGHASYTVAMCPLPGHSHPSYPEARFYGDCFSYELDSPAIVLPAVTEFTAYTHLILPIDRPLPGLRPKAADIVKLFHSAICVGLESAWALRTGGMVSVSYSSEAMDYNTDFPLTLRYKKASQPLALYSHALRQVDPLGEFLGYFRVIESIASDSARTWIAANIQALPAFRTGSVTTRHGLSGRKSDLFLLWKRRALSRVQRRGSSILS